MQRVLAIGLDGFEDSYADRLMAAGRLPALAACRNDGARFRLEQGPAARTGLGWEHFWSGLSPEAARRQSAIEFDPARYAVWFEGARFPPFFRGLDIETVVLDPPYADLRLAPQVHGAVAWGSHDPGLEGSASRPPELLGELETRVGPYPSGRWLYTSPWPSAAATRAMGQALEAGIDARGAAAQWLFAERMGDWDLALVVVAELHSAAEAFWHGVDPGHPLHDHPSAGPAAEAMSTVYEATDRLVGGLLDATQASSVVVFALGGMGTNHSDAPSMVLLPELMLRWATGRRLLDVPAEWAAAPDQAPVIDAEHSAWSRSWYPAAPSEERRSGLRALADRLPAPVAARIRSARSARRARSRPVGYQSVDWQPATWYREWWPEMRAFALPSFYDGRIRVNLRGREASGVVDVADYTRVCDEIEQLVRSCVNPRTGTSVVEAVERLGDDDDPLALDGASADLVIVWRDSPLAFSHPEHGLVGPVPYRRTGGHTGPYGFASISAPGVAPGDYGIASSFDVAPTIVDLLGAPPVEGLSGSSRLGEMHGSVPIG